jgi:hypothetical protein
MKSKSAQAWSFDLFIATIIFILGILTFFIFTLNQPSQGENVLNSLISNGNAIASSLLTQGSPTDWETSIPSNPGRIGILSTTKKLDQLKIDAFIELVHDTTPPVPYPVEPVGYQTSQSAFNTNYNFWIFLTDDDNPSTNPIDLNPSGAKGIGKNHVGQTPQNLIKVTRFTIYKDKPVTLNVIVWK